MKRCIIVGLLVCAVRLCAQVVPPTTAQCATSVDGSVVLVPNPLNPPQVAPVFSGTLPAGTYFVEEAWYDAATHTTLVSPEVQIQLSGTGQIQETPAVGGIAATAVGRNIYIGTSSGTETLQGTVIGTATYAQAVPLVNGAAPPSVNNTVCQVFANDSGWPTGTGYVMTMTSPAGNTLPGFPQQVQFLGPGNTINLGAGLPQYNGVVTYPIPILARPYGHGPQSISGPLSLSGFNLTNVGKLGFGTTVPAWAIDVEGAGVLGAVNANTGYLFNGAAPLNHVLLGNGTYYVDSGYAIHTSLNNTTTVTQTGDTAVHTIYTIPIAGGTLSATGQMRVSLLMAVNACSGFPSVTVAYGGTALFSEALNPCFSNINGVYAFVLGGNLGATNSQSWDEFAVPSALLVSGIGNQHHKTTAIDSTVAQNLTVTFQGGSNSDSVTFYRVVIEFL